MTISTARRADLTAVARAYAATPEDWPFAPRFDPVDRWYSRLAIEPGYEVWVLTWLPGQQTDLHDHGSSAGAFAVVSGELTEATIGGTGVELREVVLASGEVRRFGPRHIHRIVNAGRSPAVSVHVYGPALRAMTRYQVREGQLRIAAVDRAGVQW